MLIRRTVVPCWAAGGTMGFVWAWTGASPKTDTTEAASPAITAVRAQKRLSKRITLLLHSVRRNSRVCKPWQQQKRCRGAVTSALHHRRAGPIQGFHRRGERQVAPL